MKKSCLFSIIFSLLFIPFSSFTPAGNSSLVKDIYGLTNQFRKSKGLPELIIRDDLNAIARQHSADMASGRSTFGHEGFEQRSVLAGRTIKPLSRFAENVAYGASTAQQVFNGWKNSPGHRKNMLGKYKYIGIGIAKDRQGKIFYTEVFAG